MTHPATGARIGELADSLAKEWRAAFIRFVETGEAEEPFLEFLEKDKAGRAAVETIFNETADDFQQVSAALRSIMKSGQKTPGGKVFRP